VKSPDFANHPAQNIGILGLCRAILTLDVLIEKFEDIVFPYRNVFVQHIVAVV